MKQLYEGGDLEFGITDEIQVKTIRTKNKRKYNNLSSILIT